MVTLDESGFILPLSGQDDPIKEPSQIGIGK
jgi:hypothetical protein